MDLRARLTSLFTPRGTLDGLGYVKHVAIGYALFFALAIAGMAAMALGEPKQAGWPLLVFLPFAIGAVALWSAIFICSTVRFLRYLKDKYFE